ncbi:bifunctional metallophosphatase/5'-nucleotidase [Propioniferax innocua]
MGPGECEAVVFATSDLHAHVWRGQTRTMGMAGAATHIGEARSSIAASLWVDNGDTLTGSRLGAHLSGRAERHPLLPALEALGLDVGVPGNHDFDHGADLLNRRVDALRTACYVCCNVVDAAGSTLFAPSAVLERGGVRFGVIGAVTGHLQRLTRYSSVAGVRVLDPVDTVTSEAIRLRDLVDVLVLSYHGGLEADPESGRPWEYDTGENQGQRLMASVSGLDGVILGHQHRTAAGVAAGASGPVAYVQPGYGGERVGTLRFGLRDGRVVHREGRLSSPEVCATATPSRQRAMSRLTTAWERSEKWADQPSAVDGEQMHRLLQKRMSVSASVLYLPSRVLSWRDLERAFPGPLGTQVYQMPGEELIAVLREAGAVASSGGVVTDGIGPECWSVSIRGVDVAVPPAHVEFVANVPLDWALPQGRVQRAEPHDWLDDIASTFGRFLDADSG